MFDTQAKFVRMRTSQRGAVSSVGRAMPLQGMGHKFESCTAHHILYGILLRSIRGPVVQSVRMPACHAGGRGFEPRPVRHYSGKPAPVAGFFFLQPRFDFLNPALMKNQYT